MRFPPCSFLACVDSVASDLHPSPAALIGWTRQIKEMVNEKDSFDSPDSGPLAEIEFWRSRTEDLTGILVQLNRQDVLTIQLVLEKANSPYLKTFQGQREIVKARLAHWLAFCPPPRG